MNKLFPLVLIIFIGFGCNMLDGLSKQEGNPNEPITKTSPERVSDDQEIDGNSKTKDLISFGAGAYLVSVSSEYTPGEVSRWSALAVNGTV